MIRRRWFNVWFSIKVDGDSHFTVSSSQETLKTSHWSMKLLITYFVVLACATLQAHMATAQSCQNGGTYTCSGYSCRCPHPYSGTRCEHLTGNLRVFAHYGHGLPDEDGLWNDSDPYMEVIAVDASGRTLRRTSSYRPGDDSPVWNQWLNFGRRAWVRFHVRIYDSDPGRDDPLSSQQTYRLPTHTTRNDVRFSCYSGYATFNYQFNWVWLCIYNIVVIDYYFCSFSTFWPLELSLKENVVKHH
jgi:hypothetical protein